MVISKLASSCFVAMCLLALTCFLCNTDTVIAKGGKGSKRKVSAKTFSVSIEQPIEYSTKGYLPSHRQGDKLPLVIVQHGAGDSGKPYHKILKPLADAIGFAFINPNGDHSFDDGSYTWTSRSPERLSALVAAIGEQEQAVDTQRCVYFGFSAGATSAIECASTESCNAIGALALCGGLEPYIDEIPETTRLWIGYGREDFNYKTLRGNLEQVIARFEGPSSLNIFEETGHEIPAQRYLLYGLNYLISSDDKDESNVWPRIPEKPWEKEYRHILLSHIDAEGSRNKRSLLDAQQKAAACLVSLTEAEKVADTWKLQLKSSDDTKSKRKSGQLTERHFKDYGLKFEYQCLKIAEGTHSVIESEHGVHVVWHKAP